MMQKSESIRDRLEAVSCDSIPCVVIGVIGAFYELEERPKLHVDSGCNFTCIRHAKHLFNPESQDLDKLLLVKRMLTNGFGWVDCFYYGTELTAQAWEILREEGYDAEQLFDPFPSDGLLLPAVRYSHALRNEVSPTKIKLANLDENDDRPRAVIFAERVDLEKKSNLSAVSKHLAGGKLASSPFQIPDFPPEESDVDPSDEITLKWVFELTVLNFVAASIAAINLQIGDIAADEKSGSKGNSASPGDHASDPAKSAAIGAGEPAATLLADPQQTSEQPAPDLQSPVLGTPEAVIPPGGSEKKIAKRESDKTSKNGGKPHDRGETFELWRAFLLAHHNYGGNLNQTPTSPTKIKKAGIGCSPAMATRHFKRWNGHRSYTRMCEQDPVRLELELRLLAGDVSLEGLKPLVGDPGDNTSEKPGE